TGRRGAVREGVRPGSSSVDAGVPAGVSVERSRALALGLGEPGRRSWPDVLGMASPTPLTGTHMTATVFVVEVRVVVPATGGRFDAQGLEVPVDGLGGDAED